MDNLSPTEQIYNEAMIYKYVYYYNLYNFLHKSILNLKNNVLLYNLFVLDIQLIHYNIGYLLIK